MVITLLSLLSILCVPDFADLLRKTFDGTDWTTFGRLVETNYYYCRFTSCKNITFVERQPSHTLKTREKQQKRKEDSKILDRYSLAASIFIDRSKNTVHFGIFSRTCTRILNYLDQVFFLKIFLSSLQGDGVI